MTYESLRLLRNLLLRSAVIGLIFALVLGLTMMAGWETWMGLATKWFHIDEMVLTPMLQKLLMGVSVN